MNECMVSSPVEKITVKEICDTCGVTRQTFYRNFQDKYDLINWYFDKILIESFHQMGEGSTVYESLLKNLNISGWNNFSLRLLLKMMSRTI